MLETVDSMDAFLVPQPTDSDADAANDATERTDSDATEHATEVQGRGSLQHHQQVMLQSAPPPTYEVDLLRYWARSRPVARIFMATVADRRACRAGVGFLLILYRITFVDQDLPSPPTCLYLPRLA